MNESQEHWQSVKELFAVVIDADASEREQLLAGAPSAAVAAEVVRLLQHVDEQGPLDQPVLSLVTNDRSLWSTSLVGRSIGSYRVEREIGRGGMGTVYFATRADGEFEQRVAIKTLRTGMSSAAISQRFRQERQILAALQHPHIASLFDGGVTSDGVPYLVLEYIDGQPIDDYCAEHQLSLSARIDLFRQVLDAVAYAHRQLVVHRDLKPSNILVTKDGTVKLVDFGIAKLLGAADGDATADGWQAFTAAYAAPEQVLGLPISTATDIYALGMVLYGLLSGSSPYDVLGRAPGEVLEIVRDMQPLAPSATASLSAALNRGFARPEQLARALRGEIDAMVLMALRKEPARRYQSATLFGEDLHGYLKGMPVSARPDTFRYRIGKLVRRRWPIVAGAAVGLSALLAGTGIAMWQAKVAREEARRAALTSSFLEGLIGAADLSAESHNARLGPGASVGDFVDSAVARMPKAFHNDPRGRMSLYFTFGKALLTQERFREAKVQFDSSLAIARRIDGERALSVGSALNQLGALEMTRGNNVLADSTLNVALKIYEAHSAVGSHDGINLLTVLALAKGFQGRFDVAEKLLRRALAYAAIESPGPSLTKAVVMAHLVGAMGTFAQRTAEAESLYTQSVNMFDALPNGEVVEKGVALWYQAIAEFSRGHWARADSLSLEALEIYRRAAGPSSQEYAGHLANLATFARMRGDTATQRRYDVEAISIIEQRAETNPIIQMRIEIEYVRYLAAFKQLDSALVWAQKANQQPLGNHNPYRGQSELVLGSIRRLRGEYAEAEQHLLLALDNNLKSLTELADQTQLTISALTTLYSAWGRPADAERYRKRLAKVAAAK